MSETAALDREIMAFLEQGLAHDDHEAFNTIALREFALQYENVAPFREYCDAKRATPANVSRWQDIPAVPSSAFKSHDLAAFPLEQAVQSNITSGTTGRKNRGKVYRDEGALELILKANGLLTKNYLFPDVERMKILLMVPRPRWRQAWAWPSAWSRCASSSAPLREVSW